MWHLCGGGDCDGWTWQDMKLPCPALSPLLNFLQKVMGEQESLQLVFTVWEKIYCSKEKPEMCCVMLLSSSAFVPWPTCTDPCFYVA